MPHQLFYPTLPLTSLTTEYQGWNLAGRNLLLFSSKV